MTLCGNIMQWTQSPFNSLMFNTGLWCVKLKLGAMDTPSYIRNRAIANSVITWLQCIHIISMYNVLIVFVYFFFLGGGGGKNGVFKLWHSWDFHPCVQHQGGAMPVKCWYRQPALSLVAQTRVTRKLQDLLTDGFQLQRLHTEHCFYVQVENGTCIH